MFYKESFEKQLDSLTQKNCDFLTNVKQPDLVQNKQHKNAFIS